MGGTLTHARLTARRVVQTPRTFDNWRDVLRDLAAEAIGRGPQVLTFEAREGLTIRCPNRPGARVPVYEIFAEDTYRLNWILDGLRDRPLQALDIGGHIGTFATALAHHYPRVRVTSYEPSATTAAYLRENLESNGFASRATVVEAAVASSTGTAAFADNGAGSGQNGLASAGHDGTPSEVHTVAFGEAVGDGVDVVKIDCEGGEYDIVLGSTASEWASVQRVVIEFHPVAGLSWRQLEERFDEYGLRVAHLDDGGDGYGCAWLSRDRLPAFPG